MQPTIHHDAAIGPEGIECVAIINAEALRVFGEDMVVTAVSSGENVVFHESDKGGVVMAVEADSHLVTAIQDSLHDSGQHFVLDLARALSAEKDIVPRGPDLTWFRDHPGRIVTAEQAIEATFRNAPDLAGPEDDDQAPALSA